MKSKRRIGLLLILVAMCVAATQSGVPVRERTVQFVELLQAQGDAGLVWLALAYIPASLLFFPAALLTLGGSFAFGIAKTLIAVSLGSTLGATAAFFAGRTFLRQFVEHKVVSDARFRSLDHAVARQGFKIVLLTRLSPVLPFNLLNYAFGLTKVRPRDFILASWIGMFPGTLMYVSIGSAAKNLSDVFSGQTESSLEQKLLFAVGLLATLIVSVVLARIARRALSDAATLADSHNQSRQGLGDDEEATQSSPTLTTTVADVPFQHPASELELDRHVAPHDWINPTPSGRYHLVVIGGGPAGLVAAAGAAGLGAKVALIERHRLGGDCLNSGCVPSKALVKSARVAAAVRDAGNFGVNVPEGTTVDFEGVMTRMRALRATLAPHDSAERFRSLGVDVFFGNAQFQSSESIEVLSQTLQFRRAIIATGARARVPNIPGLSDTGFVTNETIFDRKTLPRRLIVLGGGPIGCELAQAFARFGSQVTIIESGPSLLPRDDLQAGAVVSASLQKDGVRILCETKVVHCQRTTTEKFVSVQKADGLTEQLIAEELLVAVGRSPNVESLGLDVAGVRFDRSSGVIVNDHFRTSNRRIFAAGDVCSRFKFTHAADAMARIVLQNALFPGRGRGSSLVIPRCTYTDPEVASVGLTEAEANAQGIACEVLHEELSQVDRAVLDGETIGFAKILVQCGSDQILGATIVAPNAGEMLNEVTLAMTAQIGLNTLARTIHPYPTQAEVIKRLADQFQRRRLTPFVKRLLDRWFAWTR